MNTAQEYAKRVNRETEIRLTEDDAGKLLRIAQDTLHEDLVERRQDYYRNMAKFDAERGLEKYMNIAYLQTK